METARLIALRLSRDGYGRADEILAMDSDLAMDALNHSRFVYDYEAAYREMHK